MSCDTSHCELEPFSVTIYTMVVEGWGSIHA